MFEVAAKEALFRRVVRVVIRKQRSKKQIGRPYIGIPTYSATASKASAA